MRSKSFRFQKIRVLWSKDGVQITKLNCFRHDAKQNHTQRRSYSKRRSLLRSRLPSKKDTSIQNIQHVPLTTTHCIIQNYECSYTHSTRQQHKLHPGTFVMHILNLRTTESVGRHSRRETAGRRFSAAHLCVGHHSVTVITKKEYYPSDKPIQ